MTITTRRRLIAGLSASALLTASPADAAWWLRVQAGGGNPAPISLMIPAIYSSAIKPKSGMALFNGPTPAMSIGPNATPVMLDQTLVSQGGTGVLTDALIQAIGAPGDSMGFGVVNGELMLVDDVLFMYRTSGLTRIMQWVQTLGKQTLTQNITLLLNQSWGRVWDGSYPVNQSSTAALAANYAIYTQANFPFTTGIYVPPGGWPGIGFRVGCPDSSRVSLAPAVTGVPGSLKLNSTLAQYFTLTDSLGEQSPPSSRKFVPTLATNKVGPGVTAPLTGFDFSGVIVSIGHSGYKFASCYQSAAAYAVYMFGPTGFGTGAYPNGGSNGLNFCLRNCRLGDGGDANPTHMYADNVQELINWNTNVAQPAGLGIVGRQLSPSAPLDAIQGQISPFNNTLNSLNNSQGTATTTAVAGTGTNSVSGTQYVALTNPVPSSSNPTPIANNQYGGTLPAGLCCWLLPTVDNSNNVNTWVNGPGTQPTIVDSTFDGRHPSGFMVGMAGNGSVFMGGYGGPAGALADVNGNETGFQRNAIIGTNQDAFDVCAAAANNCVIIIGGLNGGSHEDVWQVNGTAPTASNGVLNITNSILDCRQKCYGPQYFIEGVANPWFALYGGAPKLAMGYQDSVTYWEAGFAGTPTYGDVKVTNNWMRGGGGNACIYMYNALQPGGSYQANAVFAQTSPAAVALYNAMTNENNLLSGPGFVTGENIAFNPNYSGGALPPAVVPHKLYQIAGYCIGFATVSATNNSTTNVSPGDILTAPQVGTTGGGVAPTGFVLSGSGGQAVPSTVATFKVLTTDGSGPNGSGKALTIAVVNPGSYSWAGGLPTTATVTQSSSGGSGSLSFTNTYGGNYHSTVLLRDPITGNLVDTSGSSTGTGTSVINSFKQILRGLHQFSNNWVSEHYENNGTVRLQFPTLNNSNPLLGVWQDAASNFRNTIDSISIENNRYLYGAAWAAPGNPVDQLTPANTLNIPFPNNGGTPSILTGMNPTPQAIGSLVLSPVSTTQMQVTFTPDPNSRLSPDGGALNPSGYQYMIWQTGSAMPTTWSTLPATTASGSKVTATLPDVLAESTSYDAVVRGVSCYDSPEMVPRLTAANSNVATALTLAS